MSSSPPPPGPVRNIHYPEIPERRLASGLELLCVEDPYLPQVSITLALPWGRAGDRQDLQGLSQLTMEMLKEGTRSRSAQAIAETMDELAIDFQVEVQMESAVITLTCLEPYLETGLELLVDLLFQPVFPEPELGRVKSRWRSLLIGQRADPGFLAGERLLKALFQDHPYGRASIPLSHLEQITAAEMGRLVDALPPKGSRLAFTGCIRLDRAAGLAERYFGHRTVRPVPSLEVGPVGTGNPELCLVHRPGSHQARIALGRHAPSLLDPAYLTLRLANQVLGGGASSRLFLNLREQKGYTYGIYSTLRGYYHSGFAMIGAALAAENVVASLDAIFAELEGLQVNPAADEELERSRAELIGSFIRSMETPASVGAMEVSRRLAGLPEDFYAQYIPRLEQMGCEAVTAAAASWFRPDGWHIVVVGDRDPLESTLQRLGKVKVFDVDGRRVDGVEES